MIKCHNCKQAPTFVESEHKDWPVQLKHSGVMCPYGIDIYHNTKQEARQAWRDHLQDEFPFFYKGAAR